MINCNICGLPLHGADHICMCGIPKKTILKSKYYTVPPLDEITQVVKETMNLASEKGVHVEVFAYALREVAVGREINEALNLAITSWDL